MLLYSGTHKFWRDDEPSRPLMVEFASASASEPSEVKAWVGDELIEHTYVGVHSPHTWWGNNGLFCNHEPAPDGEVTIFVGPNCILRIESNLVSYEKLD
jgi:hypothetical protein